MPRRKRKASKVKVTRADGSIQVVRPGHFEKQRPPTFRQRAAAARRSKHWKRLRVEALKRDRFQCVDCSKTGCLLEVHHLTYERMGAELLEDVVSLCQACHASRHRWKHVR